MHTLRKMVLGIALALVLFGCSEIQRPDEVIIKIIETSDLHGKLFPYDFVGGKPSQHSLAHIGSYISNERKNKDQIVILLDNGDILQGIRQCIFTITKVQGVNIWFPKCSTT